MSEILGTTFKTKEDVTITVSRFMFLSVVYSGRQLENGYCLIMTHLEESSQLTKDRNYSNMKTKIHPWKKMMLSLLLW